MEGSIAKLEAHDDGHEAHEEPEAVSISCKYCNGLYAAVRNRSLLGVSWAGVHLSSNLVPSGNSGVPSESMSAVLEITEGGITLPISARPIELSVEEYTPDNSIHETLPVKIHVTLVIIVDEIKGIAVAEGVGIEAVYGIIAKVIVIFVFGHSPANRIAGEIEPLIENFHIPIVLVSTDSAVNPKAN